MSGIPTHIGKYEIERRLGQGGMGSVYLARARDLDRYVAIKVLREQVFDEELLERFFREARASANLRHENIITIYDIGQHEHQPYMALEYVDGQTLFEIIRHRPALPLAEKLAWVEQICAGLHFAHGAGIVHRDIKPANVMVDRHGVVRILDFGIARVEDSGMTRDGAMIGTLNYMSPEQMLGRPVDFRSDIFAVGTLAYELITYNKAFPGSFDDGLLQKLPYEDPPPLGQYCEGLPGGLQAAVWRALAKRPEDRYGSLEEMRSAIRDIRRDLDPALALETIVVTPRRGAKPSTAGKSTERPEFAERRARQIAVHLDAAREALGRQDLDSALAACEDALTLAPDNVEAQALLEQVDQARRLRDDESRARRDRERSVRQRVADADLQMTRGDIAAAVEALAQAAETDPANAAVKALAPRLGEAARSAGIELPVALRALVPAPAADTAARTVRLPRESGGGVADPREPHPSSAPIPPTVLARPRRQPGGALSESSTRGKTPLVVAAAAAVALTAAGAWVLSNRDAAPVAEGPATTLTPPPESPLAGTPSPSAPLDPEPVSPAPSAPPRAAVDTPPPLTPAPATTTADAAVTRQIEAATTTYQSGDLEGALNSIEGLVETSSDPRPRRLALTLAQDAMRAMTEAADAADLRGARERAPQAYATAVRARERAERARQANRPVVTGRAALVAVDAYRLAEREAIASAAAAAVPPPAAARETPAVSAAPPAVTPAPPQETQVTRVPAAAAPPAANAPASAATTRPSPADAERAGIRRALALYQSAHKEKNLNLLLQVYPSMAREAQQGFGRMVKDCASVTVDFTNYRISFVEDDPSKASVFVRSTYTCQPPTGQGRQGEAIEETFQMEKVDSAWLIENMSLMDTRRRR